MEKRKSWRQSMNLSVKKGSGRYSDIKAILGWVIGNWFQIREDKSHKEVRRKEIHTDAKMGKFD